MSPTGCRSSTSASRRLHDFGKSDSVILTYEASNDRGGKGGAERSETLMKKMEPHAGVGNSAEHSGSRRLDPASKRALIAAKARSNPRERFNSLLHHLTYELVKECLLKISLSSAPGVDGMTAQQARDNLNWILPPLLKQIHGERSTNRWSLCGRRPC